MFYTAFFKYSNTLSLRDNDNQLRTEKPNQWTSVLQYIYMFIIHNKTSSFLQHFSSLVVPPFFSIAYMHIGITPHNCLHIQWWGVIPIGHVTANNLQKINLGTNKGSQGEKQ